MNVDAGQLKKVVVFQKNTPTTQGAGKKDSWATLVTTRGFLEKNSGRRSLDNSQKVFDNSWKLITRFESILETNLNTALRVLIDGKYFTIDSWEKKGEKRFHFIFQLSQHGET
jgi:hypothetical protein